MEGLAKERKQKITNLESQLKKNKKLVWIRYKEQY